jgi:hypothetical protein
MQLMDTVDHLITLVEVHLEYDVPVPTDAIATLLDHGVDYSELEGRILNNANGDTTHGE